MTKKPKKTKIEYWAFRNMIQESDVNSVLETVLTDYEPQDRLLAFLLNHEEKQALDYLEKERFNTNPKRLVEHHIELAENAADDDLDSVKIRKWVYCRQARYYLENNDAELAAKSIAQLNWQSLRTIGVINRLDKDIKAAKKRHQTIDASFAKKFNRGNRLIFLNYVLESEGFTAESIGNRRNARTVVYELLNNMLGREGKKTVSRDQFNKDMRFLREHSPEDVFQDK